MTVREPYFDPGRDQEESATHAEHLDQLRSALDLLGEIDKKIVTLRCIEGLSNHATAEAIGLTDQAASMRYLRAIRRLRKLIANEREEP